MGATVTEGEDPDFGTDHRDGTLADLDRVQFVEREILDGCHPVKGSIRGAGDLGGDEVSAHDNARSLGDRAWPPLASRSAAWSPRASWISETVSPSNGACDPK